MILGRRRPLSLLRRLHGWLWPHIGWHRAGRYLVMRLRRLPGTPHSIAVGFATGAAVVVLALTGIVFPSLNALIAIAGLWLVLAPWATGYGDEGGPVGLSDSLAGVSISALAISALAAASRRSVPGAPMPIGRVRRPLD